MVCSLSVWSEIGVYNGLATHLESHDGDDDPALLTLWSMSFIPEQFDDVVVALVFWLENRPVSVDSFPINGFLPCLGSLLLLGTGHRRGAVLVNSNPEWGWAIL